MLAIFLFQKKATAFIARFQNRGHTSLLLVFGTLKVVSELIWHLVKLDNPALQYRQLWDEALGHQLLVLLRVEHLLRRSRRGWVVLQLQGLLVLVVTEILRLRSELIRRLVV